jgi:hypothetical protein
VQNYANPLFPITNQLLYQLSYTGVLLCKIESNPLDFPAFSAVLLYGCGVKAETTKQMWTKTGNLVRNKNGRYYARLYLNGKEIWKSLGTDRALPGCL